MKNLRAGDLVLTSVSPGFKAKRLHTKGLEAAFRVGTTTLQGPYTHAAIYVGDDEVVEADIFNGVRKRPLADLMANKSSVFLRVNEADDVRTRAAEVAKTQVGKGYSKGQAAVAGLNILLGRDKTPREKFSRLKKMNAVQCATLVNEVYRAAGAPISGSTIAPVHLLASPKTRVLGFNSEPGFNPSRQLPFSPLRSAIRQRLQGSKKIASLTLLNRKAVKGLKMNRLATPRIKGLRGANPFSGNRVRPL